jgi:hypothetical protein
MTSQQQFAGRRTVSKGANSPVHPAGQPDLQSTVESLLRDVALVLHATATLRRAMKAEKILCPAVS